MTLKEHAQEMERVHGGHAKVTWLNIFQLLDLYANIDILVDRIADLERDLDYKDLKDTEEAILFGRRMA